MKISKFFKFASLIGLGTVVSLPILMLTSCSSEPSIKQFEYNVTVGGTSVKDLKSEYIKGRIANVSSIAAMLMSLNLSTSNQSLLVSTPEVFAYLMGNSWICGGSTYVDESYRISFGMTEIKVNGSGFDSDPSTNQSSIPNLVISNIEINYGFYNPDNGTQIYTDINQIKNMLNNNPNINKEMVSKITSASYTATFSIEYSEELEMINNAKDFSLKSGTNPSLTVGSSTISGTDNVANYISDLNKLVLSNNPNEIDQSEVQKKYSGSITDISET